jgi:glycosyltransferase involved in cell wall biosynthesis
MKSSAEGTLRDNTPIARKIFTDQKVALFIVAYNAEKHIGDTLSRIPEWCRPLFAEIYVIDDSSKDDTFSESVEAGKRLGLKNLSVMRTPGNQGYGGNQKIGYMYAMDQGHDIVILLHGDGQYPPERIPDIVAGYADPRVDAVFGSRMINRTDALRGGMPLYKWVGNQVLTSIENTILGTDLSEFHSGYRSYRVRALGSVPFHLNNDGFHFDTDIIIQLTLNGSPILEVPMPTHYGDEKCHVNGMNYAWNCIKSAGKSRLHRAGIFFQPNFEITEGEVRNYQLKSAKTSLHAFVLRLPWKSGERIADLGANDALLSRKIAERGPRVTAADMNIPDQVDGVRTVRVDLNEEFDGVLGRDTYDKIIALDIIEHLHSPEQAAEKMHRMLRTDGLLLASTANIGYVIMRLTHLFGWFNYGKKGILDRTHHRLFTIKSFRRLLENSGFSVIRIRGFGPPIVDAFGDTFFWRTIDRICAALANAWPALFAFNFLVVVRRRVSTREKTDLTMRRKIS